MHARNPHSPTYDLEELKALIKNVSTCHITETAFDDAVSLGFASEYEIVREILKLQPSDFYKTQPSEKKSGQFQDVYKMAWEGDVLYIKLRKSPFGKGVVISFHI